jgi:hypothetical protein
MKLEAVVVCVNYSDFLAHTLSYNKALFDNMVVVTDLKDEKTKKLCEFYNVTCVQTDEFYANSSTINKGRGINEGLKQLSMDGWVLHLDADIFLPPLTREILEKIEPELDKNGLFTIDRMMCPTYEAWQKYINDPTPFHEGWIFVHTSVFPIGTRIAEYKSNGWEPIGFFQLWHPKTVGIFEYPNEHGSIDRSDVIFTKYWRRGNRHLIPELIGIHIESEALDLSEMGKNWNGRKTKIFGPEFTPKPKTINNRLGIRFYWKWFIKVTHWLKVLTK